MRFGIESHRKGRIFLGKTINLRAGAASQSKQGFARLETINQSQLTSHEGESSLNLSARSLSQLKLTETKTTHSLKKHQFEKNVQGPDSALLAP